jgi:NIMA (never in mitosis gene a)-related kinase
MDKYRKAGIIGKGHFGVALRVFNIYDKQFYTMKVIDLSKMTKKERINAVREVDVMRGLKNEYIISYRESFISKKYHSLMGPF